MQKNHQERHFIAAIKSERVRDAQACYGDEIDWTADDAWKDVEGSIIIFDGYAISEDGLRARLSTLYQVSNEIFDVYEVV